MAWFAVKTFYRRRPSGPASRRDSRYKSGLSAIEERIVLFKAADGKSALQKGRREAQVYAKSDGHTTNVYGQSVRTEVLKYAEAFELFTPPREGTEVFSSLEVTSAKERSTSILRRKVGKSPPRNAARMFLADHISRSVNF